MRELPGVVLFLGAVFALSCHFSGGCWCWVVGGCDSGWEEWVNVCVDEGGRRSAQNKVVGVGDLLVVAVDTGWVETN